MKRFLFFLILVNAMAGATVPLFADGSAALATVKKLVGFIRYEKNDLALRQIGLQPVSQFLMGSHYEKATVAQRIKFQSLLGEYVELRAFPLALQYFKDIDPSYDAPVQKGQQMHVRSSLLYAGSEQIVFTWVLSEHEGQWVITDFLDQRGVSSMSTNRDKQIQPVLKAKGVVGLINQMEKIVAAARKAH
ncbi:MAG: ABC transporter substrate-binding protein [Leptospiraceae bacterium]|nr:ABC transporter substrate-binding protein [Leptospiraceae bacterium]